MADEQLSTFEIMQRFRNDGSCEYLIREALDEREKQQERIAELEARSRRQLEAGTEVELLWQKAQKEVADLTAQLQQQSRDHEAAMQKVREDHGKTRDVFVSAKEDLTDAIQREAALREQLKAAREALERIKGCGTPDGIVWAYAQQALAALDGGK